MTVLTRTSLLVLLAALSIAAAGCRHGEDEPADPGPAAGGVPLPDRLGEGEGRLDLIALSGYVEDGSSDPAVDWVTAFEERTGCRVTVRVADSTEAMVRLMRSGRYDGGSVSGDAALLLVDGGDVAPLNTGLIPSYGDLYEGLRDLPHTTVDGRVYGVPQGRAANVLMWRRDIVRPAPDSWSVVWEEASAPAGRVAAYDSPLAIADAALYLRATRPDLGIEDVYELDDAQFEAALTLLEEQQALLGVDWTDFTQLQAAFAAGTVVVGTSWQLVANLLLADGVEVATTLPEEGATGWSDTWMISSAARHPNCMYRWLDHMLSPRVNAQVAEWFGHAPANRRSCDLTTDTDHCTTFHADDEDYYGRVAYWRTPRRDCGDDRGAVCKDYADWVRAWDEIDD